MAGKQIFEVNPQCIFELTSKPEIDQLEDTGEFYLNAIGVRSDKIPLGRQLLVATGPIILSTLCGLTNGYSAILLPQLQEPNSTINIAREEESWIGSIAVLSMILGCILGGIMMEVFGRKMCMMLSCIPFATGWLLFIFAKDTILILIGRFITGACSGIITPPMAVFIGESTDPKYRGILLAGLTLGQAFGIFLAHILGTYLSWRIVALILSLLPIACMVEMHYVPESPSWLAKKDKTYQARMAFRWSRGNSKKVEKEFTRMLENSKKESQTKTSYKDLARYVIMPKFLKPFFILCVCMITTQWSGNNAIIFYTVLIVKQTIGEEIDEYLCTMIVDIVRMLVSLVACYLVETMGRKLLMIVSGFGSATSLLGLSLITYLVDDYSFYIHPSVSLVLLASFMAFITVGLIPIPWILVGEIFPLEMRSFGSGLISVVAFLAMFSVVKTGPFFFEELGTIISYLVYGSVCLFGTGILCLIMPETKGKILEDIEGDFEVSKNDKTVDRSDVEISSTSSC